jgi:hypothetical protein
MPDQRGSAMPDQRGPAMPDQRGPAMPDQRGPAICGFSFVPFLILIFQKDQILSLSMRRVYYDRADGGSEIGYYFPNLYQLFQ